MATPSLGFDNFFSTTLSSTITASDTTVYLNSLPTASEGFLVIEPDSTTNREIIYYTSKGVNFVTLPSVSAGRGVGGTSAIGHSSGVAVQENTVAEMFEALQDGSAITYGDGWLPGSGTWTYASATTFTVPTADAARMSVGTKIKLTQTTSKYFYVTGVSGTTITVNGGTDYTVANAAITAPYFSNQASPQGFPDWFNYTPAWSSTGTQPAIGNGTIAGKFRISSKQVFFKCHILTGSTTTYGTGNYRLTYPVTPWTPATTDDLLPIGQGKAERNGTANIPFNIAARSAITTYFELFYFATGATPVTQTNLGATTPYTWANTDNFRISGSYEAA